MIAEVFGQVLREVRVKQKISQEELAASCELDRTYISLLERGKRQPTITTIFLLSDSLNIAPDKLIKKVHEKIAK